MADTNPIILSFQTEGLEKSNAELKATATNINAIGTATNDVTADIVNMTNAVKQSKEQLATLKPNTKEFKVLSDEIKAAEVSINGLINTQESLRAEFANVKKDIGQVNAIMKEMEKQGLTNTQTYKGLAAQMDVLKKKGGELKDSIGDMNQEFKTLGSDTRGIDTVIQGVQGIAAGFQIAQGASALFGGENKKLEETLVKLNATMAIAQGLQQVQALLQKETAIGTSLMTAAQTAYNFVVAESTIALTALRAAILATGIGAFTALIYGAYEAFKAFQEGSIGATDATLKLVEASKQEVELQKQSIENLKKETEYYRAIGKTKAQIAKETLDAQINLNTALLAEQVQLNKKLEEQKPKMSGTMIGILSALNMLPDLGKKTKEELAKLNKEIEAASKQTLIIQKELDDALEEERQAAAKKEEDREKKRVDNLKANIKKANDQQNELNKIIEDGQKERDRKDKEAKDAKEKADLERYKEGKKNQDEVDKNADDEKKKREKAEDERLKKIEEKKLERANNGVAAIRAGVNSLQQTTDSIFELNSQARQDELNQDLANLDARKQAELEAENVSAAEKEAIQKEYAAKERALKTKAWRDEQNAKREQAIINGALAITNILATMPWFSFGIAQGIAIASVVATTAIQVAKISAQKPPKFAEGGSVAKKLGYIEGKPHSAGGELIEVEGNEYVMKGKAVNEYGVDFLDSINNLQMETMPRSSSDKKPLIDYNKLGAIIGEKLQDNSRVVVNIDRKGLTAKKGGNTIMNNKFTM